MSASAGEVTGHVPWSESDRARLACELSGCLAEAGVQRLEHVTDDAAVRVLAARETDLPKLLGGGAPGERLMWNTGTVQIGSDRWSWRTTDAGLADALACIR